jgi:hypothetical protein
MPSFFSSLKVVWNGSQIIFADESHFNCLSMCRPYAWAPQGNRAQRQDFFICGQKYISIQLLALRLLITLLRYSILPALCLDGILHLEVQDHPFSGDKFANFVEGVLAECSHGHSQTQFSLWIMQAFTKFLVFVR